MKYFILIISCIFTVSSAFCQKDSILTFRLEKLFPDSSKRIVFLEPEKTIFLSYNKERHMSLWMYDGKFQFTETSVLYKKDTVLFKQIQGITGVKTNTESLRLLKKTSLISGITFLSVAAFGAIGATFLRGAYPEGENKQYDSFMSVMGGVAIAGVSLTFVGIIIPRSKKTYDVNKGWTISSGYYNKYTPTYIPGPSGDTRGYFERVFNTPVTPQN